MRALIVASLCLVAAYPLCAQAPQGYYRYPTIHGGTIVFAAEGDLWTVGTEGGVAQRLTTHAGSEEHPAISADGRTLAFSASYEGPVEVYTMPLAGGLPTRRTYEGGSAEVVGWTPDGKLLYSTSTWSSSTPLMPGIRTSARTSSGRSAATTARARSASSAVRTTVSRSASASASDVRIRRSSSTIRIERAIALVTQLRAGADGRQGRLRRVLFDYR